MRHPVFNFFDVDFIQQVFSKRAQKFVRLKIIQKNYSFFKVDNQTSSHWNRLSFITKEILNLFPIFIHQEKKNMKANTIILRTMTPI